MGFYSGKNILITGGTGMIGRQLVELLLAEGAKVRVVSLDDPSLADPRTEFLQLDLRELRNCLEACKGMDVVFHLAGVKGSPKMTREKPASFFVPTLLFNTAMMEAARRSRVEWFLYTSTIGVYAPAEIFREDDVWKTFPSENDKFAGWAKRMGELQAEAYRIEYGWDRVSIVRPANVYGPYDNFDPQNAMVIPSLIARVVAGENPLVVWGDGSSIRDFIHARDVARGMMLVVERGETRPVNLGSGKGHAIKEVVEIILKNLEAKPEVVWDTSKPSGDKVRLMDISRARSLGFEPQISLEEGIAETIKWYREHQHLAVRRYNIFRHQR